MFAENVKNIRNLDVIIFVYCSKMDIIINEPSIIHLRTKARERNLQECITDAITVFFGTDVFRFCAYLGFGIWILLNAGRFGVRVFDSLLWGLLTMVESLGAIFLSTTVFISQNRLVEEAEYRADLDLLIELLTEYELSRVLHMLDTIGTSWVLWIMRTVNWQTLKWEPGRRMY